MAFGKQKRRLRSPLVESYSLEYYSPCLQTNPNNINSRPRPAVYICRNYPMYLLPASSCIPEQNAKSCVNVISEGSPILIRSVRRISFGMTIRPRSSILLTIPVAFILCLLFMVSLFWDSFAFSKLPVLFAADGDLCIKKILTVRIVYRQSTQICIRVFSAADCAGFQRICKSSKRKTE